MFEANPFRIEPIIGQRFAEGQRQKQSCGANVVHDLCFASIGWFAKDCRIKRGRSVDILNGQDDVIDEKFGGEGG